MSSQRSHPPARVVPASILAVVLSGCLFPGAKPPPDPEVVRPYEAPPEERLETITASPVPVDSTGAPIAPGPRMATGTAAPLESRWGDPYWKPGPPGSGPGAVATVREARELVPTGSGWLRQHDWLGDDFAETEPFFVASEWKLVWRSGDRPSNEPLLIEVYREAGEAPIVRVTQDGASEISSLQLPEPGAYYLQISGGGGQWYVAVEVPAPVGS